MGVLGGGYEEMCRLRTVPVMGMAWKCSRLDWNGLLSSCGM